MTSNQAGAAPARVASILIPAHNEESGIVRLLDHLTANTAPEEFEIIVLCNGCTDGTATAARVYEPAVKVVELPEPSKRYALKHGDGLTPVFPRAYVDSDVDLGSEDIRALVRALQDRTLVAAPCRVLVRDGMGILARAYYDVWEQLPRVSSEPFGRGVVMLSAAGHGRVASLPAVMADDLAMTVAFSAAERTIVGDACVKVWPPRRIRDLVRRRVRVVTGNAQMAQVEKRSAEVRTTAADLVRTVRNNPGLLLKLPVFVGVTVSARIGASRRIKKGDFTTWLRDDSSRVGG